MFKIGQNGSALVDRALVITGMIRACCSFLLIGLVLAGCATLPT